MYIYSTYNIYVIIHMYITYIKKEEARNLRSWLHWEEL